MDSLSHPAGRYHLWARARWGCSSVSPGRRWNKIFQTVNEGLVFSWHLIPFEAHRCLDGSLQWIFTEDHGTDHQEVPQRTYWKNNFLPFVTGGEKVENEFIHNSWMREAAILELPTWWMRVPRGQGISISSASLRQPVLSIRPSWLSWCLQLLRPSCVSWYDSDPPNSHQKLAEHCPPPHTHPYP